MPEYNVWYLAQETTDGQRRRVIGRCETLAATAAHAAKFAKIFMPDCLAVVDVQPAQQADDKNRRQRGQALVETSLMLPILLLILLLMIDPVLFMANNGISKIHSYNAAREASVWIAGGSGTCAGRAYAVATPSLLFGQATGSLSVWPCPADPYWTTPTGDYVQAVYSFEYNPVFWPNGPWSGTGQSFNVFQ